MTHVTVVQVHDPHLGQVQRDGMETSVVGSSGKARTPQATKGHRRMMTFHEGSFAPKESLTSVTEVLYVNVMELRQQDFAEGAPETTYSSGSISSSRGSSESEEALLQFLPKAKKKIRNRRLSRKSSIMNQNVGVTGGVFMKSDPSSDIGPFDGGSDSESESSLSASESSLYGSDSGLSSTIEVGMSPPPKHSTTITIGDEVFSRRKDAGSDEALLRQKAIGNEASSRQKTFGNEEASSRQKAIGNEVPSRQQTIGNEVPSRQKAIGNEEVSSRQKAVVNDEFSSRQKGILLHVSPKPTEESSSDEEDRLTSHHHPHDEVISIEYSNFEVSEDLSEAAVTLEWRVIPPSHGVLQHHAPLMEVEGDRGSTPTSFSSAYTVTEHESESTSEESETSRNNNWSGQESDEEPHEGGHTEDKVSLLSVVRTEGGVVRASERLFDSSDIVDSTIPPRAQSDISLRRRALPTLGDTLVKEAVLSAVPSVLRRLRLPSEGSSSSGEESIVYSYIPCRDQREKEDEELWVANEAADPTTTTTTGAQDFDSVATPPLLPPPEGWGGGGSLERSAAGSNLPGTGRSSVCAEQCTSEDVRASEVPRVASVMCTVAPTITGDPQAGVPAPPRKHYSTRQRAAETQVIKFKVVDEEQKKKYKDNCHGDQANLPTSTMTCKPTKRFSFLVRSNSVRQEGTDKQLKEDEPAGVQEAAAPPKQGPQTPLQNGEKEGVTPSDQAILDKLASLNIETPAEVKLRSKPRVSLFDPPCTRCGEPVYPQERTEPTLRLVFHSSCFKCHHCGVRLTLKTFYRSPLDSRDTRLFCRSHVPTLDPGKLDTARSSDSASSSGKSSPDCTANDKHSDSTRGRTNSPATCIQERLEIVKCDTIGLRYF
ncbi:uncharacterized protein LOC135205087 [Macrobrachium nipponense]|uniref:uncharacterized protein LOC135205087 n=1 Tax=Macrobrachium nipponense TaxID=159736 RepID=UPI0030C7C173